MANFWRNRLIISGSREDLEEFVKNQKDLKFPNQYDPVERNDNESKLDYLFSTANTFPIGEVLDLANMHLGLTFYLRGYDILDKSLDCVFRSGGLDENHACLTKPLIIENNILDFQKELNKRAKLEEELFLGREEKEMQLEENEPWIHDEENKEFYF